jgi:hypothetical protein
MLLNRCTGESWLLMPHRERRTERLGYHWVPLAMLRPDEAVSAVQPPPAPPRHRVRVRQTPPDRNCFSFNRRRFCE